MQQAVSHVKYPDSKSGRSHCQREGTRKIDATQNGGKKEKDFSCEGSRVCPPHSFFFDVQQSLCLLYLRGASEGAMHGKNIVIWCG
jgi:hypothetical protein